MGSGKSTVAAVFEQKYQMQLIEMDQKISEAEGMYNYLVSKGFNKDKLILEDKSNSTKQNAEFSVPIAEKLGADIVIVCSSLYHFEDLQYHALENFIKEVKKTKMSLMIYTK